MKKKKKIRAPKLNKRPAHRPSIYSDKLIASICKRIAGGESLRSITKEKQIPTMSTFLSWLTDGKHKDFSEQYERSCNARAEHMFDELLEISDKKKEAVQRSRLRVDTRKWYLSKLMPKKFGDKVDVTSGGKPIPLLHVLHNDSNQKDTGAPEKN